MTGTPAPSPSAGRGACRAIAWGVGERRSSIRELKRGSARTGRAAA
ncbi:hypothetical protein [Nonomuraea jabiensis]